MTTANLCPNCNKADIDDSGTCPSCGYKDGASIVPPEAPDSAEHRPISGLIEMDYSVADEARPEVPEWRLELSRRLQEIKTKRESPASSAQPAEPAAAADAMPPKPPPAQAPVEAPPERRPRRPPRMSRPEPRPEPEKPVKPVQADEVLPLFRPAPPTASPVIADAPPLPPPPGPTEAIQQLIDRAVARQTSPAASPAPPLLREPSPTRAVPSFRHTPESPGRLILLSRTLAGLVDLIVVGFCTVLLIIAADGFSGIEIFDAFSMANYGLLLLATYSLYSVFFLFTANQTIGMMITDLRLTDEDDRRPRLSRILLRCGLYPVSLLAAGVGLLWGCFDRQARCAHDRFSGTRVVRVSAL